MAIVFNLAIIHAAPPFRGPDQKSMEAFLYTMSVIMTPWPLIFLGYYFPLERLFRQWKQMYYASFNQLKSTRARIRYLLNEGRLPFICLLYIGHFTIATISISALYGSIMRTRQDYVEQCFLSPDITYPFTSVAMLLTVIVLAWRYKKTGVTHEMPR
jgi:hypothetical protein